MTFFFLIFSCQNGDRENKTNMPNEITIPSSEHKKFEKSNPRNNQQKTIEKPIDQNTQKKKSRAIDTLKPVTTVP